MIVGRYSIEDELARGGMASVHLGRLRGDAGFGRTVAIKRLHPQHAKDRAFVAMLVDEARLVSRIRHENVVPILDVVQEAGELFLVMEYVAGATVSQLLARAREAGQPRIPAPIAVAIACGVLRGLHAAHTARDAHGEPLGIVHRDVSPQNVMVGLDGVPRVLDFGVARAEGRVQETREGVAKGKLPYMAPEQIRGGALGPAADVYAGATVLWEMLVGERYVRGTHPAEIAERVLFATARAPSAAGADVPATLDEVVLRGLARTASARWESAQAMASALESALTPALASEVGAWVEGLVGEELAAKQKRVEELATIVDASSAEGEERSGRRSGSGSERPRSARPRWVFPAMGLAAVLAVASLVHRMGSGASAAPPPTKPKSSAPPPTPPPSPPPTPPPASSATPPATATASASTTRPTGPCDRPWTLDSGGHKIYKRECL